MKSFKLTPSLALFYAVIGSYFGLFLVWPVLSMTANAFFLEGEFSLTFLMSIFNDPALSMTILRSLWIGFAVTFATLLISLPLAYACSRLSFKGKAFLQALTLVPLILPPFVGALGMRQFFARFGSVNLLLMQMGIIDQPIDWFGDMGFWGVVFLEAIHLYPIMFLNLTSALANIDPAMEEAAQSQGAGPWKIFRSITFPLTLPGFFAGASIVFIWAFTDLGTPLMMGYRQVAPVQIFQKITEIENNPQGYALVLVVLVVTALTFVLSGKLVQKNEYAMISKGGAGTRARNVGWFGHIGLYALFLGVFFMSVLPHIGVILNSVRDSWFMTILPESYTMGHWEKILSHNITLPSIMNSIKYSFFSTILDVVLGVWLAYMIVRKKVWGSKILDAMAMLPLALPGIVLAFGFLGCFIGWDAPANAFLSFVLAPFYGGREQVPYFVIFDPKVNPMVLLIIAYSVRRIPFIVRSAAAGFQQVSHTFEEASASLGANPAYTVRKITIPLISSNLVAGVLLTFIFAMLEVSDSLILAFREETYPITKAIYSLAMRLGDGPFVASALGVWGMLLLTCGLLISSISMGSKLGQLFRASG